MHRICACSIIRNRTLQRHILFSTLTNTILIQTSFLENQQEAFTFAPASLIRPAPANPPGWERSKGTWL
jgi:hypothetical protein